jgi:DNA polymerase-1
MIGLDVETTALSPDEGRLRLIQVAGDRGTQVFDADVEGKAAVRQILEFVQDRHAVAHNANFEELWARTFGADLCLEDTLVMSRVLYGGTKDFKKARYVLADVVKRELGSELDKEMLDSDWSSPLTEEQLPQEVRRLRERANPLAEFLNSSEWDAFWQPAKAAIVQGDESGIRA